MLKKRAALCLGKLACKYHYHSVSAEISVCCSLDGGSLSLLGHCTILIEDMLITCNVGT
jgi:hypothetical protein